MNTVSLSLISSVIYTSNAYTVWEDLKERFDKDNASRACYLHKEIATLTQGISIVSVYYTKLRELWDEYETLTPPPTCGCAESRKHVEHYQIKKLYQLLTGLNESYENAKNRVLMTWPLPNLNQAYAMIVNVESQRINKKMYMLRTNTNSNRGYKPRNSFGKAAVWCGYYKYKGHTRENCFNLHRHPSDFKNKRNRRAQNAEANSVTSSGIPTSKSQGTLKWESIGDFTEDLGLYILKADDRTVLKTQSIVHQSSCTYTPQKNGVVERKHRSILDMARALRYQDFLPLKFWGECVSIAVYLLNRLPNVLLQGKSFFEKFFQRSPSLQHLRVFGSLFYATTVKKGDKFFPRAITVVHMGIPLLKRNNLHNQLLNSSDDSSFPAASSSQNYTDVVETSSPSISVTQDHGQSNPSSPIYPHALVCEPFAPSIALRKSSRTTKPPVWLADYVAYDQLSSAYKASLVAFSAIVEPKSFSEASRDPKWVEAMQAEITTLEENNTWSIVALPFGKVPIGCK
ncbi:uncharacterized protein LOC142162144 [Nicotiana tabacum]|uniref:Uncharacterized protein LOC142162144 n=1 Tax=Nicotiana tabacum TaxID=4097 RepID=A0AC58RPD7_TOBAC